MAENSQLEETPQDNYDESTISVLKGTEGVRHRPSMYIGDVGSRGLHHLVFEVIDNSVDEAMANRCSRADIILHQDGFVSIRDDGAGIPSDIHPEHGISTLELILTTLHSGGKFNKKAYTVSGGLHGVGLSVVCALSEEFYVESVRENKIFYQTYARGEKKTEVLSKPRNGESRGTLIKFKPDHQIFNGIDDKEQAADGTILFNYNKLRARFEDLAYLTPGFTITFNDERKYELPGSRDNIEPQYNEFNYPDGLRQFVTNSIKGQELLDGASIFYCRGEENGVIVEIALTYTHNYSVDRIKSYVNNIHTHEGGTHESGFRRGLTSCLNKFGKDFKLLDLKKTTKDEVDRLESEDTREGIFTIISAKVPEPQFEGQTKTKLGNSEIDGIVSSLFRTEFYDFLQENMEFAKAIFQKAKARKALRAKQKKFLEAERAKASKKVSLPGKLYQSQEKDPMKRELFIVEGASAGGSAVEGRDSQFQEILFMRGKVLNVEKATFNKLFENAEIRNIITAIGAGIDDEFDVSKVRYGKIIILTDADVDGQHIATLLLTLFYRHMRPLIENERLFIARPPLYKLELESAGNAKKVGIKKPDGKNETVFYCDERRRIELEALFKQKGLKDGDWRINRFKGLGEMNANQLGETAMNKATRHIDKVVILNEAETEKWVTTLMGDDVSGRKDFITNEVFTDADDLFEKGDFFHAAFDVIEEQPDDIELDKDDQDDEDKLVTGDSDINEEEF